MTTIKHRNGKIFAYHIFTCEISCYYSTMSEDDDIVVMTGNFTREDAEKIARLLCYRRKQLSKRLFIALMGDVVCVN